MQNLDKGVVFTTEETMQVKAFGQPLYKDLTPVLDGYMEIVRPRGLPRPFVIGVSLNQIAARANSVGIIDADYYEMQAEQWARLWGQLYTRFMTGEMGGNSNGSNENVAGPQSDKPAPVCDPG